jgi:methanogenic corrinoid protein MtbC1
MIGQHYQKKNIKDDLILISTPEGELHEIGILASALLCVHYNVRFIFLGANLPATSLAEAANALKPKALLLGVIKGHEISEKRTLEDYLSELVSGLQVNPEILIGGNLRPYIRSELEKKKISYFPTLELFDEYLQNF